MPEKLEVEGIPHISWIVCEHGQYLVIKITGSPVSKEEKEIRLSLKKIASKSNILTAFLCSKSLKAHVSIEMSAESLKWTDVLVGVLPEW